MGNEAAAGYIREYLALMAAVAALEVDAQLARQAVVDALHPDGAAPGTTWKFEGAGTVVVVKGRESVKLERAKLARAGVAAEVLDAATTTTVGKPGIRITAWEDSDA